MRTVDTSLYSSEKASRIKPDTIDLSGLPRIEKPPVLTPAKDVFVSSTLEPGNPPAPKTERISERTEFRTEIRSVVNPLPSRPPKRRTTRYSFEFYEDQILKLKALKHQVEMSGSKVTLSDIAREALDDYLRDKNV